MEGCRVLDHVSAGQARFNVPGVACDARGIVLGRLLAILLPSIDRVVALFRGLSEQLSLDDLLHEGRISRVQAQLGAQELLVRLPVSSSHVADTCAAVARLVGGLVFTGTARHFVAYRDERSPLGYDAENLFAGADDFVLYAPEFEQSYRAVGEINVSRLLLELALQRKRDDWPEKRERLLLRLEKGLWQSVVSYLHRNGVACAVAATVPVEGSNAPDRPSLYLVSVDEVPRRMLRLFRDLPGVCVYRMRGEKAATELGYEHPLVLESCSTLFDEHALYLFSGSEQRLEVLQSEPHFVSSRALVELDAPTHTEAPLSVSSREVERLRLDLRLVRSDPRRGGAEATIIDHADAERFRKLVYLLPPTLLNACRACVTTDAIYVVSAEGLDFIPLGELCWSAAPAVFLPLGFELMPAIAGELLLEHLGAKEQDLFFWRSKERQVRRLSRAEFAPLSRLMLAEVPFAERAEVRLPQTASDSDASLVNDDVGLFPLWGFADESSDAG
jgi:hypothetical protein